MSDKIQIRRGNKANLPVLAAGEPGVALDTKEFFIGSSSGNIELLSVLSGGFKVQSGTVSISCPAANTLYTAAVTFPVAFGASPIIFLTVGAVSMTETTYITSDPGDVTGLAFTARVATGTAQNLLINWIAIGT